jgi:hypothetical protein
MLIAAAHLMGPLGTNPAWACHRPAQHERVHVSFLADSDLAAMVKWAKETSCVEYAVDPALSGRRLGQSVILTVTGQDLETVFDVLLHSMNLRTTGSGSRRHIVAAGPETEQSRESNQREKMDAERDRLFDHIESEIHKKDDSHFSISRKGADATLANMGLVTRSLRVVPESRGNRPIGFRIVEMKPTSVLARLGFLSGDVVQSLNGRDLTTPEKALEAYVKLRSARHFQARILRGDKPLTIDLVVID